MGYVVKKVSDKKNGVTTKRLKANGTPYWQVVYENRSKGRAADVPREQIIHRNQLETLGIDPRLDFAQVKTICTHLNDKANLKKRDERVRSRALAMQNQDDLIESAFLPKHLAKLFEERILVTRLSGTEKLAGLRP